MQLSRILTEAGYDTSAPEFEITHITNNSNWVEPGDMYVAVRGAAADGHDFIPQAVSRGAVVVAGEGLPAGTACPVPYLTVPHAREFLADAAAALYQHPSRKLKVAGVTGTDGKTTTTWLTHHLLGAAGHAAGLLSTVGFKLPDGVLRQFPAHFTTPEAPQVQEVLAQMVAAGADSVALEASSHALALDRVRAVDWDVAIWTHLTQEHLDFHGTVEQYFRDKCRLVERSPFAVINRDDAWYHRLTGVAPAEWSYSAAGDKSADWYATDIVQVPGALQFTINSPLGSAGARLPMVGAFNVANALAAAAGVARLGASLPELVAGLGSFGGVPGRMELVPASDIRVVVDFAHTPPSLRKALDTLRTTTAGEMWVVLGSAGGPRDPSKRAPLGAVATELAEHVIFTEEDHRYTPIWDILHEMERGAREHGRTNFESIPDRREAIRHAILTAQPGDTVVLAGKGPEETLERDHETLPWDEVAEARAAVALRHSI